MMKCSLLCVMVLGFLGLTFLAGAQDNDFPVPQSPYLGQVPPGTQPSLFAPGVISTGVNDMDITFTADGKTAYFSRSGPDYFSAILYMKAEDSAWNGPFLFTATDVNTGVYPFISADGKTIFFDMDGDIYLSLERNDVWGPATPLDSAINTDQREGFTSITIGGNLYFSSNREDSHGGMDIYVAVYSDGKYTEVVNLGNSVNSEYNEFHACISPKEQYIVFDSQRPGGFGRNDLYISFKRSNGTWTTARNMGKLINTEASDMRPYITADGRFMFFSSDRSVPSDTGRLRISSYDDFMRRITGPGNGSQDIYWVSTSFIDSLREVCMTE